MQKVLYFNCIKLREKKKIKTCTQRVSHCAIFPGRPTHKQERVPDFIPHELYPFICEPLYILAVRAEGLFLFDMGRRALLKCRRLSSWHNNSTWIRIVRHSEKLRGWHLSPGEGELSHHEVVSLKRVWRTVSFEITLNQSGGSSRGQAPWRGPPCSLLFSSLKFLFLF